MKSIVLLVWLTVAGGQEQVIMTRHVDSQAICEATAHSVQAKYAGKGQKTRFLCHEVVEEVGDVDVNGNPIEPPKAFATVH